MVIPDGHDEHHGHAQRAVELGEAADLCEAVAVAERLELRAAELGRDVGVVGWDAVPFGTGNLNLLSVLDKELAEFVFFEAGDDAVGWKRRVVLVRWGYKGREAIKGKERT